MKSGLYLDISAQRAACGPDSETGTVFLVISLHVTHFTKSFIVKGVLGEEYMPSSTCSGRHPALTLAKTLRMLTVRLALAYGSAAGKSFKRL